MFDLSVARRRRLSGASMLTTAVALAMHLFVVAVIVVAALATDDVVPATRALAAFIATPAPPPAPPPPPTPAAEEPPKRAPKVNRPKSIRSAASKPVKTHDDLAVAPLAAPAEILPEAGSLTESADDADDAVDAPGVEGGIPGGVVGGIVGGSLPTLSPPRPSAPPRPVRVGGHIVAPRVIHRVNPDYPRVALDARLQGLVILEATVDAQGRVDAVRVLRSNALLEEAAVRAVRQWRYEPLLLNGTPTPFVLTVTVGFSLK